MSVSVDHWIWTSLSQHSKAQSLSIPGPFVESFSWLVNNYWWHPQTCITLGETNITI